MKIICQIGVIFAVCWFSQLIEAALPVPFPASVIGMLLLLALLATGLLKIEHIREKADFLLANMAFFFLPAGLAIGACSHAVGTSKALELGETEGAMSGLAIGVCGLITVVLSLFLM